MIVDINKEVKSYKRKLIELSNKLEEYSNSDDSIKTIIDNVFDFSDHKSNKQYQTTLGAMIRLAMSALGWNIAETNTIYTNLEELHSFITNCFYDDTYWYLDFRSGEFIGHTCDTDNSTQDPKKFLEVCYYALSKYNEFFTKEPKTRKDFAEFYETSKSKKVNMTVITKGSFVFQFKDEDDIELFKHTILRKKLRYAITNVDNITIEVENG